MKKILTLFLLSMLTIGVGWAESIVSFDNNREKTVTDGTLSKAGVSFTGVTADNHYLFIVPKDSSFTVTSTVGNITKIRVFRFYVDDVTPSTGTMTSDNTNTYYNFVWTGNSSSVTFLANKTLKPYSIMVYVDGDATPKAAAPTITPGSCNFDGTIDVTLSYPSTGGDYDRLAFTLDGKEPNEEGSRYFSTKNGVSHTITMRQTTTLKAKVVRAGYADGDIITTYTASNEPASEEPITGPKITPASRTIHDKDVAVTITTGDDWSSFTYNIDGGAEVTVDGNTVSFTVSGGQNHTITARTTSSDGTTYETISEYTYAPFNPGEPFVLVTSLDQLQEGDEVIVVGNIELKEDHSFFDVDDEDKYIFGSKLPEIVGDAFGAQLDGTVRLTGVTGTVFRDDPHDNIDSDNAIFMATEDTEIFTIKNLEGYGPGRTCYLYASHLSPGYLTGNWPYSGYYDDYFVDSRDYMHGTLTSEDSPVSSDWGCVSNSKISLYNEGWYHGEGHFRGNLKATTISFFNENATHPNDYQFVALGNEYDYEAHESIKYVWTGLEESFYGHDYRDNLCLFRRGTPTSKSITMEALVENSSIDYRYSESGGGTFTSSDYKGGYYNYSISNPVIAKKVLWDDGYKRFAIFATSTSDAAVWPGATQMSAGQCYYPGLPEPEKYRQAPWIEILLNEEVDLTSPSSRDRLGELQAEYEGHLITNVNGVLIDKLNPTLYQIPTKDADGNIMQIKTNGVDDADMNPYCPANFVYEQLNVNGQTQGAFGPNNPDGCRYFMMDAKPQEYCNVFWCTYPGYGEYFYSPESYPGINEAGIYGKAYAKMDLYDFGGASRYVSDYFGTNEDPHSMYAFCAIARKNPTNDPNTNVWKGGTYSSEIPAYTIYPVPGCFPDGMTSVDEFNFDKKTVESIHYYNQMGMESSEPFEGINIVEVRYTDGSRTTSKVKW